jgi:(+)-trans-carveol dehydrogenase
MTNTVGRVADKVALITSAARGQGCEHAVRLAEEGADIIAVDACDDIEGVPYPLATEADLDETAALVEKLNRRIVTAKADVRDLEGLCASVQWGFAELGRPDVVVADAGISGSPAPGRIGQGLQLLPVDGLGDRDEFDDVADVVGHRTDLPLDPLDQ